MKYIVILTDGMADEAYDSLGGKSPMEAAHTPLIDSLAQKGEIGLVQTVPQGMAPGSDVANLSVLGYDPLRYHTGRSPLEAISMGLDLRDDQASMRCNLVTLDEGQDQGEGAGPGTIMKDYSAGEISTDEAARLIQALKQGLDDQRFTFHAGISYRHLLLWKDPDMDTVLTPPHDISGQSVQGHLPQGKKEKDLAGLMARARKILKDHPVNAKRIKEGKNPATDIWLWGLGKKTVLPAFKEIYGVRGSVISAVDLLKGIAKAAGLNSIDVEGATGTIHTNFKGKAQAAMEALEAGDDYVYLHLEAPDESSHQGQLEEKIKALEMIEEEVIAPIYDKLKRDKVDFRLLILPDHPTPVRLKTHTSDPVPYVLYDHKDPRDEAHNRYSEKLARQSGHYFSSGPDLAAYFLEKGTEE